MIDSLPSSSTVIDLGYVGLPLAVALARHGPVTGLDVDQARIEESRQGHDRTHEITPGVSAASSLQLAGSTQDCPPSQLYIVTVPTPIDAENRPDLSIVEAASGTVGSMLRDAVDAGCLPVVLSESKVYPEVTEDICGPILEREGNLVAGRYFWLAYKLADLKGVVAPDHVDWRL